MAARRRNTTTYNTYGSVAYAPAYDGSAVRVPRREEELQRRPQPKQLERVRHQELTRTQVQVREAGQVAPFAVVGFLAVAVFAALLLMSAENYGTFADEPLRFCVSVLITIVAFIAMRRKVSPILILVASGIFGALFYGAVN